MPHGLALRIIVALFLCPNFSKASVMGRDELDTLFKQYETAFNNLDLKTISAFYADIFMSAGPKGVIAQDKAKRKVPVSKQPCYISNYMLCQS